MSPIGQAQRLAIAFSHVRSKLKILGQAVLLGVGTSLCLSTGATAAETVILKYNDTELAVPVTALQAFVETGEAASEALAEFVGIDPQIPTLLSNLLDQEIALSPDFEKQLEDNIVGEFLLFQLNKLLSDPSQGDNLASLQAALLDAYRDDNRFSLLEVVEEYPEPEILVNLGNLEQVYQEVSTFVARVQPALETLQDFLEILTLGTGR